MSLAVSGRRILFLRLHLRKLDDSKRMTLPSFAKTLDNFPFSVVISQTIPPNGNDLSAIIRNTYSLRNIAGIGPVL
jgi:hypothetical protein